MAKVFYPTEEDYQDLEDEIVGETDLWDALDSFIVTSIYSDPIQIEYHSDGSDPNIRREF